MGTDQKLLGGADFVALSTQDLAAAAVFDGETLGLERSVYIPERHYSEFETGNLTLSIIDGGQMGIGHNANRNAIPRHVEDVKEARETLEARGVSFSADTLDTGVCHMAFFSDPDGNALMLHHRYAPRASDG